MAANSAIPTAAPAAINTQLGQSRETAGVLWPGGLVSSSVSSS